MTVLKANIDFEGSTSTSTFFDQLTGGGGWGWVGNYGSDHDHFAGTDVSQAHVYGHCNSGYCYTGVNQSGYGFSGCFSISTVSELYMRFYLFVDDVKGTPNTVIINFFHSSGGGYANRLTFSSGNLACERQLDNINQTIIATAADAFPTQGWHLVEVHNKLASDSTGVFDVKVDGLTSGAGFTFSGQTVRQSGQAQCLAIQLQNPTSVWQQVFFDDVAVNDASGGWVGALPCAQAAYWGVLVR